MGHGPAGPESTGVFDQGLAMSPLTRVLIADAVTDAFGNGGARRSEILAVATRNKTAPTVLDRLAQLLDHHFPHVRDLWKHMPEVPVA
jgi:hypothetical protein